LGVLSFRGYPLGVREASWLTRRSFPARSSTGFNFAHPDLSMKQPTGWWADWGNPLSPRHGTSWEYETDAERDACGALMVDRLDAVVSLFDRLAAEPDLLVSLALTREQPSFEELPLLGNHLRHPTWRAALLIRRGPSAELEQALADRQCVSGPPPPPMGGALPDVKRSVRQANNILGMSRGRSREREPGRVARLPNVRRRHGSVRAGGRRPAPGRSAVGNSQGVELDFAPLDVLSDARLVVVAGLEVLVVGEEGRRDRVARRGAVDGELDCVAPETAIT